MNIKKAFLIGLDIYYFNNIEKPLSVERPDIEFDELIDKVSNPHYIQIATGKYNSDCTMLLLRWDQWYANYGIYNNFRKPGEYWEDKIVKSYLMTETNFDYLTWFNIIELKPWSIPEIIKLDDWDYSEKVNELLFATLPECKGDRLGPSVAVPKYSTILFIEPSEPILSNENNLVNATLNILSFLNEKDKGPNPHFLVDVILIRDLGKGTPHENLTCVSPLPLLEPPSPDQLVLPVSVIDVARFLSYIRQQENLLSRLKKLSFGKQTVREYLLKMKRKDKVSDTYEERFHFERYEQLSEQSRVLQINDTIRRNAERNDILKFKNSNLSKSIENVNANPRAYGYYLYDTLIDTFENLDDEIRDLAQSIETKANSISDYLRDLVMTETNRANLDLQKKIEGLTSTTVFIAIVALIISIISILPQYAKDWIVQKILKLFSALFNLF